MRDNTVTRGTRKRYRLTNHLIRRAAVAVSSQQLDEANEEGR
jgi:hypothetical protein